MKSFNLLILATLSLGSTILNKKREDACVLDCVAQVEVEVPACGGYTDEANIIGCICGIELEEYWSPLWGCMNGCPSHEDQTGVTWDAARVDYCEGIEIVEPRPYPVPEQTDEECIRECVAGVEVDNPTCGGYTDYEELMRCYCSLGESYWIPLWQCMNKCPSYVDVVDVEWSAVQFIHCSGLEPIEPKPYPDPESTSVDSTEEEKTETTENTETEENTETAENTETVEETEVTRDPETTEDETSTSSEEEPLESESLTEDETETDTSKPTDTTKPSPTESSATVTQFENLAVSLDLGLLYAFGMFIL